MIFPWPKMPTEKVRWGIVSTAEIGVKKVIPGILNSAHSEVAALASRDLDKARSTLDGLGLRDARAYGSYDALLADDGIDAVYNPLPNHLHVPVTLAAARAGKHVLCEKPIGLTARETEALRSVPKNVLIAEAFMVRWHPQWQRAREIVRSGELGRIHLVSGVFTYFNDDPQNVRNLVDIGGGGLLDIGCYCVIAGRYMFETEPKRVVALVDRDARFGIDRLASVIADFGDGRQLSFVCGTQTAGRQSIEVFGPNGSLEIVVPFNAPPNGRTALLVGNGAPFDRSLHRREVLPPVDQYTSQAEAFALAVLGKSELAYGVEDAISQMRVLDAIFRSEKSGAWEIP